MSLQLSITSWIYDKTNSLHFFYTLLWLGTETPSSICLNGGNGVQYVRDATAAARVLMPQQLTTQTLAIVILFFKINGVACPCTRVALHESVLQKPAGAGATRRIEHCVPRAVCVLSVCDNHGNRVSGWFVCCALVWFGLVLSMCFAFYFRCSLLSGRPCAQGCIVVYNIPLKGKQ